MSDVQLRAETKSPFLPGTHIQFAWDSTSLGWFKTCPRLYQYHMIEGWAPRGENIHLRWGIEYHQALQDYDISRAAGLPFDDALHDTIRALLTRIYDWEPDPNLEKRSETNKTKAALVRSVIWYLDKFKEDPAETYIMEDGKPAVELSFRFELDWGPYAGKGAGPAERAMNEMYGRDKIEYPEPQPYLLSGHLDRVVRFNSDLYVMDRKTTTSTPGSYYFAQFEPNNQMTLYTLASQVIFQTPIKGVIIDAAQVAVDFSRFTRGFTYRTQPQIDEWVNDLRLLFARAEDYVVAGYWPMNDTACGNYGGCRFREICSKSPQVREQFLKSNFDKQDEDQRWNPLKSRG